MFTDYPSLLKCLKWCCFLYFDWWFLREAFIHHWFSKHSQSFLIFMVTVGLLMLASQRNSQDILQIFTFVLHRNSHMALKTELLFWGELFLQQPMLLDSIFYVIKVSCNSLWWQKHLVSNEVNRTQLKIVFLFSLRMLLKLLVHSSHTWPVRIVIPFLFFLSTLPFPPVSLWMVFEKHFVSHTCGFVVFCCIV